jgi:A/G-specific adenine glycosylase
MIRRRPPGLWSGFWEFPTIHKGGADPAGRGFGEPVDLADGVERLTGIRIRPGDLARTLTFGVTKHRVTLDVYKATATPAEPTPGPGFSEARWIEPGGLPDLTLSSATRRVASAVASSPAEWGLADAGSSAPG